VWTVTVLALAAGRLLRSIAMQRLMLKAT
jgi:hypothetical protein